MKKTLKNRRIPRSLLSAALALSLLLSTFSGLAIFADNTGVEAAWDGTAATEFENGAGTQEDPYIVSTPAELLLAVTSTGRNEGTQLYYKMVCDIYVNDVSDPQWPSSDGLVEWPIATVATGADTAFGGVFNGNGYKVYGLYVNEQYTAQGNTVDKSVATGLFPTVTESAEISAVGVENSYFALTNDHSDANKAYVGYVGIIAGYVYNASAETPVIIDRCYAHSDVSVRSVYAGLIAGVKNTVSDSLAVTNCYSLASATVSNAVNSNRITMVSGGNSAKSAKMDYNYAVGGINWSNGTSDNQANYSTEWIDSSIGKKLKVAKMQGASAFDSGNMEKLNGDNAYTLTDSYPILKIFAGKEEVGAVWNGGVAEFIAEGGGTEADPYIIKTASELAFAVTSGGEGAYYRLGADIHLNDVSSENWYESDTNNSWYGNITFSGHIDGDGHIVFGLWYKKDNTYSAAGLIPVIAGGSIKNLGIRYSYIKSTRYVGGFVGKTAGGTEQIFEQCFADDTVEIGYTGARTEGAGGILGYAFDEAPYTGITELKNCYSKAVITGKDTSRTNGLVGTVWTCPVKITDCYSVNSRPYVMNGHGTVSALYWDYTSGVRYTNGAQGKTEIENVLSGVYTDLSTTVAAIEQITLLDAGAMRGDAAKTSMSSFDFEKVWQAVEEGTPKLKQFVALKGEDIIKPEIQPPPVISDYAGGTGVEKDPYIISNAAQLRKAVTSTDGYFFRLSNDIYINDVSNSRWFQNADNTEWVNGTRFSGHIDGDGHTVYGIWYPKDNTYTAAGLIPMMNGGTVKNLGIRSSYIYAAKYAGAFVGRTYDGEYKALSSCFADETVHVGYTASGNNGAGGLIGFVNQDDSHTEVRMLIENCYCKANVSGLNSERVNGLIGTVWNSAVKIVNSYSVGTKPYFMQKSGTISSLYWNMEDGSYSDSKQGLTDINNVLSGVYSDTGSSAKVENYTVLEPTDIRQADKQAALMKGFDFEEVWQTVENGTPKLKIFTTISGVDLPIVNEAFPSGVGTKDDPYMIETVEQLRYLIESSSTRNKFYKLKNDLYVNDTTVKGWMNKNPESWYNFAKDKGSAFEGTFDGDGHFVYGLYLNETPATGSKMISNGAGLFPRVSMNATIKNVHLRDSYVSGVGYVGSIVGYISGSSNELYLRIIGCSADASVTLKGQTVGGILGGGASGAELQYVYFTGKLTSASEGRGNGLVGDVWNPRQRVVQSYSVGYTNYRTGYIPNFAVALYGTASQSKTTKVAASDMYGSKARKAMPLLDSSVWQFANGKTPHPKVITDDMLYSFTDEGVKGRVWSGKLATKYARGSGTKSDPYIIETPEQMAYFVNHLGDTKGKFFSLAADLKMNDTSKNGWENTANQWFTSEEYFEGIFDGCGHVVSGLYFSGDDSIVALIPRVTRGSVVKRVGLTKSSLTSYKTGERNVGYVGGIVGYLGNGTDNNYPVISQCFGDDTVVLKGSSVGGIVAGGHQAARIDNCYFTGVIDGDGKMGTMVGNTWDGTGSIITNCYSISRESNPIGSNNSAKNFKCQGVYHEGPSATVKSVKLMPMPLMKGDKAKSNMPEFDYVNIWKTVENGTPVLRCFANAEKYTAVRPGSKVEISFATEGGESVASIYGYPGDPIGELPQATYYAHEFKGWYVNKYKVIPFESETFPTQNMVVYAKWEAYGFSNGFEGTIDEQYDINEGAEHFRPGVALYNPKYLHSGSKSLRTVPDSAVAPVFITNYAFPLEKGKCYDVNIWVYVREEQSGSIELLQGLQPDYYADTVGYNTVCDLSSLVPGTWTQVKYTVTANAPYLLVRTSKGAEVFYDDIFIVPTFGEGTLGELEGFKSDSALSEPIFGGSTVLFVIVVAGGVVLSGAIATAVVIIVRKKKKQSMSSNDE